MGDGEGATVPYFHGGGIGSSDGGGRTEVGRGELVLGTTEAALSVASPGAAATPGSWLLEGVTHLGKGGSGGSAFLRRGSPVSESAPRHPEGVWACGFEGLGIRGGRFPCEASSPPPACGCPPPPPACGWLVRVSRNGTKIKSQGAK